MRRIHETGRAACFWIDVHQDHLATALSPQQRMETLILSALTPVVQALEATGWINAKFLEQHRILNSLLF